EKVCRICICMYSGNGRWPGRRGRDKSSKSQAPKKSEARWSAAEVAMLVGALWLSNGSRRRRWRGQMTASGGMNASMFARRNGGSGRIQRGNGNRAHDRFLLHNDRRADRRVVEKRLRHFFGDANAAVRGRVRRDVALMHGVTTAEEHSVRHAGAVVMRARRF